MFGVGPRLQTSKVGVTPVAKIPVHLPIALHRIENPSRQVAPITDPQGSPSIRFLMTSASFSTNCNSSYSSLQRAMAPFCQVNAITQLPPFMLTTLTQKAPPKAFAGWTNTSSSNSALDRVAALNRVGSNVPRFDSSHDTVFSLEILPQTWDFTDGRQRNRATGWSFVLFAADARASVVDRARSQASEDKCPLFSGSPGDDVERWI